MIATELERILEQVSGHRDFETAILAMGNLQDGGHDLFHALWKRAIRPQGPGEHVALCAIALYRLNLPCPFSLEEAMLDMGQHWDISIEELPWYLARQFSEAAVIAQAVQFLERHPGKRARWDSIVYWVGQMKKEE